MPKTLEGITVVDLTQNIAGPFCTQLLGDFGATVFKIERPGLGDDSRRWAPPYWGEESASFLAYNRNKKSVCIELNHPRGLEVVLSMVEKADVFVHSLKPQSARARGLSYENLRARNPRLIFCAISGFGSHGPFSELPGYDPILQAYTGHMSITGNPDEPPVRMGAPVIDMGTGMWAFIGILIALMERQKTGKGSEINTSLLETGVVWTTLLMAGYLASGEVPEKVGSRSPLVAPYEAFEARDGWIMIAAGNDNLFRALCRVLEMPELSRDPRFSTNADRVRNRDELHRLIQARIETRRCHEWANALRAAGVPCSPINSLAQVCADEQVKAMELIKEIKTLRVPGFKIIDLPVAINGERATVGALPPRLGEHTDEVLRWAGFDANEITELRRQNVIA